MFIAKTVAEAVGNLQQNWADVPRGAEYPGAAGVDTFSKDIVLLKLRLRNGDGTKRGAIVAVEEELAAQYPLVDQIVSDFIALLPSDGAHAVEWRRSDESAMHPHAWHQMVWDAR